MAAKKIMGGARKIGRNVGETKRLSKWAKWWQANPKGLDIEILDMRAVMK